MKASIVVVDNGDPNLEECLKSLRNQSVKDVEIIFCPGPKSNLEVAKKYVDTILPPMVGIGKSRIRGILAAKTNYIISCDSDSIYSRDYVKIALEDLKLFPVVKAGTILPLKPSNLGYVESLCSFIIPYEFALSFRRDVFLEHKIHLFDYDSDPRRDIGPPLMQKVGFVNDPRLIVWSKLPTTGAKMIADDYSLSILMSGVPGAVVGGTIIYNMLNKTL